MKHKKMLWPFMASKQSKIDTENQDSRACTTIEREGGGRREGRERERETHTHRGKEEEREKRE
jgi:hypothetical protein